MARITDLCQTGRPVIICDVSPPRGIDLSALDPLAEAPVDGLCVAYNPGKSVRLDSAVAAHALRKRTGKEVVFNLATRDMNKLAIQSHLLGAHLLGLQNVVVVQGDPFTARELEKVQSVEDFRATELMSSIRALNEGVDYRGLRLRQPTAFCVGASLDMGRGVAEEARLTRRKVEAGAEFFLTQPIYDVEQALRFEEAYAQASPEDPDPPVFYGLQVLVKEGVIFGNVPAAIVAELERGRPGVEIAGDLLRRFLERGLRHIYLVPPILKGGVRDYAAVNALLRGLVP